MSRGLPPDCPHCRSTHVISMNRGRKAAVMLGGLAGGISSAANVWNGARIGAAVGAMAGPAGSLLSAVAGAVLAALAGGAAGCAAGAVIGDLIDDKVLANYRCLNCNHRFSHTTAPKSDVGYPHELDDEPPEPRYHARHDRRAPAHAYGPMSLPDDEDDEPYGFYRPFPPFPGYPYGAAEPN